MKVRTRRNVLCSIAGAAALAGCSESVSTDEESFERVAVEETELVVELAEDTNGDLAVINPDGEVFAEADRTPGETRLRFELGVNYTPGEYEVALVDEDEQIAETSIEIRPELEIVEVGIGENHPNRMPGDLPFAENQVLLVIENSGTGPESIRHLEITGSVPDPTTKEEQNQSGIFDVEDGFGEVESVMIEPENSVEIFSSTRPFGNSSPPCVGEQITFNFVTNVSEATQTSFEISYEETGDDDCRAEIHQEVE